MHHANRGFLPRQPPTNLHQTTRITRHNRIDARALDRFDLLIENRDRDLRILHRKRAAKTETRFRIFNLNKLRAAHVENQSSRLALQIQITQAVTRVVPSQLTISTRAHVFYSQDEHEKRAKLA